MWGLQVLEDGVEGLDEVSGSRRGHGPHFGSLLRRFADKGLIVAHTQVKTALDTHHVGNSVLIKAP